MEPIEDINRSSIRQPEVKEDTRHISLLQTGERFSSTAHLIHEEACVLHGDRQDSTQGRVVLDDEEQFRGRNVIYHRGHTLLLSLHVSALAPNPPMPTMLESNRWKATDMTCSGCEDSMERRERIVNALTIEKGSRRDEAS
jgi:hypothetical protein